MRFEFFIGGRYLKAKQKQAFISLIAGLSICGVTVGVMALVIVIAVMSGAESDIKSKILGFTSHITLMHYGGNFTEYSSIIDSIRKIDGVETATPLVNTQVLLRSANGVSGVVLRGIDPTSAGHVIQALNESLLDKMSKAYQDRNSLDLLPGIILGKELATNLGVIENDIIYLISPKGMLSPIGHLPAMKRFKIIGFLDLGMYEYDSSMAYIHIEEAQKFLRINDSITGIEIRVTNIYDAKNISERIISSLGYQYWARDWMQMSKNLFSALKLQKTVMFIILTLIILVAAFNIASSLIMMVMEKNKDIAILKAMGATNINIKRIFIFKGMIIGAIGTLIGLSLGLLSCFLLKRYKFIKLDPSIYPFPNLPVNIEVLDIFLIAVSAMIICYLSTLYPARQASKLNPVEAIRYG